MVGEVLVRECMGGSAWVWERGGGLTGLPQFDIADDIILGY
jgi:hypothetical protein